MTDPIPKNLQKRLAMLFQKYQYTTFTFNQAMDILKVEKTYLGRIMGSLQNTGWIEKSQDPLDNRKKTYKIKNFDESFQTLATKTK